MFFFSILWLLGLCLGIVSLPRLYRSPYVLFWRFYSFMGFKIFYLLVMDIMCLDPIHPIFSSLPEPTQHPKVTFPSQLHVQISSLPSPSFFLFSFTTTEFVQCCLYVHGCGTIYWNMGKFSGPASLEKSDNLLCSHQLPVVPQVWVTLCEPLLHSC